VANAEPIMLTLPDVPSNGGATAAVSHGREPTGQRCDTCVITPGYGSSHVDGGQASRRSNTSVVIPRS
jgi:hypothetical protein